MAEISIKIHNSYRKVIAICDTELIGKKFEEGNRQLDCRENFYKEKAITFKEAVKTMEYELREDATFNIIGKKSIKAAIESGVATESGIDKIQNIPFTLKLL